MSDCRIPVHGFACIPCERSCNAEQKTDRNEAEHHGGTEHFDEFQLVFHLDQLSCEAACHDEAEHIDEHQFVFQLDQLSCKTEHHDETEHLDE